MKRRADKPVRESDNSSFEREEKRLKCTTEHEEYEYSDIDSNDIVTEKAGGVCGKTTHCPESSDETRVVEKQRKVKGKCPIDNKCLPKGPTEKSMDDSTKTEGQSTSVGHEVESDIDEADGISFSKKKDVHNVYNIYITTDSHEQITNKTTSKLGDVTNAGVDFTAGNLEQLVR